MAKNKDKNISPSKGISIIIKNEFPSQLPITPKKNRRINVLSKNTSTANYVISRWYKLIFQ